MTLWMALGLMVGLFGIVHVVFIREESSPDKLNSQALQRLAQELSLEFTFQKITHPTLKLPNLSGRLTGSLHGFQISAYEEPTHNSEPIPFRSVYQIDTRGHTLSPALLLYRQSPPSHVGKILGGEDIEVGLSSIDQAFVIRDACPKSARAMFARPGVAEAFLHLTTLTPGIFFENHKLTLTYAASRLQPEQARASIHALLYCAQLLCETDSLSDRHDARTSSRKINQGASPTWQAAP